jgi:hypothetical protein
MGHVQPDADLLVGQPGGREPRYLKLLRRQRLDRPPLANLPGSPQFDGRPVRPGPRPKPLEGVAGRRQVSTSLGDDVHGVAADMRDVAARSARPPQPLAVEEVGPRQVERPAPGAGDRQRPAERRARLVVGQCHRLGRGRQ